MYRCDYIIIRNISFINFFINILEYDFESIFLGNSMAISCEKKGENCVFACPPRLYRSPLEPPARRRQTIAERAKLFGP